eukprot:2694066-Ditylum_brightwellii.AAC.1
MSATQKKAELENIDKELITAMLAPEQKIPVPHHAWWSDTLKDANFVVLYWKTKKSYNNNCNTMSLS